MRQKIANLKKLNFNIDSYGKIPGLLPHKPKNNFKNPFELAFSCSLMVHMIDIIWCIQLRLLLCMTI